MDKKQKIINTLNNHFGRHNDFPEINSITDQDFEKIITLFEEEASKDGKDPWHYLYFDDLIIMQKCTYEVIKDNSNYIGLTSRLEKLYERELNRRLERTVYEYGEPTDKKYQAPYSEMPEYSLVLAEMCSRQIQEAQKQVADSNQVIIPESALKTYESIKESLTKVGIPMPEQGVEISNNTRIDIDKRNTEIANQNLQNQLQREQEMQLIQQQINTVENQVIEIQQRISGVIGKTIGSYYSGKIAEQYPEDSQKFEQLKERINEYKKQNNVSFSDLKQTYDKVRQDLTFYQEVLPVFEIYEQRFETIQTNDKQEKVQKDDERARTNLYFHEENLRLQDRKSLYTAYDLGRRMPEEYANLSYDELNDRLVKEQREKFTATNEQELRKQAITGLIKSQYGNFANNISDVQYKNLSVEYDSYSTQQLQTMLAQQNKTNEIPTQTVNPTPQKPTQTVNSNPNFTINEFGEIIRPEATGVKEMNGGVTGVEIRDREKDVETVATKFAEQPKRELQPLDFSSVLTDVERKNLIKEILELENPGMKFDSIPQQYMDQASSKSIDELREYRDSFKHQDVQADKTEQLQTHFANEIKGAMGSDKERAIDILTNLCNVSKEEATSSFEMYQEAVKMETEMVGLDTSNMYGVTQIMDGLTQQAVNSYNSAKKNLDSIPSNDKIDREQLITDVLKLENQDVDWEYAFLTDLRKHLDSMSVEELSEYKDSLAQQPKGKSM